MTSKVTGWVMSRMVRSPDTLKENSSPTDADPSRRSIVDGTNEMNSNASVSRMGPRMARLRSPESVSKSLALMRISPIWEFARSSGSISMRPRTIPLVPTTVTGLPRRTVSHAGR